MDIYPSRITGEAIFQKDNAPIHNSAYIPELAPQEQIFHETYPEDTLDFSVIGDWGAKSREQSLVANALEIYANRFDSKFIVNVGDSFYKDGNYTYDGVSNENDEKFQKVWKDVYNGTLGKIPWYSVAGNHDWYNNVTAEVDYSLHKDARFFLPSLFYVRQTTFGPDKTKIAWIHIDTNTLFYDYSKMKAKFPEVYAIMTDMGWGTEEGKEKIFKWIEAQLALSQDAKWIFVVGHHPLIGGCANNGVMTRLPPIFDNYHVDAYFSGHEHSLAYQAPNNTYHFADFLSGAGSKLEGICVPNDFGLIKPGFVHISISDKDDKLDFQYVDVSDETINGGTVVYHGTLKPRSQKKEKTSKRAKPKTSKKSKPKKV
ncbi:hypothetical protein G9A89_023282 [Geosiphon pyriformis]|nr:hypothetical protein G9A89_023282 [Geosiphon pyriformis]